MIHKLSRFLLTLVALFAMTTGAWAEGTVYNSSVDIHDLQADDILVEDAEVTGIESSYGLKVMPYFLQSQDDEHYSLQSSSQAIASSDNQVTILEGGVLERVRNSSRYTYTPCDADRNPYNAWIVTQIEELDGGSKRVQITGYQYGSAEVEATVNLGEKTNLLEKFNQAKNSGLTLNVGTGDNAYTLNFDKDAVNSILEGNPEEVNIETTYEESAQMIGTTSVLAKLVVNLTNGSQALNFNAGKVIASLKLLSLNGVPTGKELQTWFFDNVNNLPTELIPTVYDAINKMATVTMSHFSTYGLLLYDPEAIVVTPTENKNEWTFKMPAYDVEVNVEYETALALNEETDNAVTLEEWDGYEADVTLTRTLTAGMWNTLAVPFSISATNYAALQQLLSTQGTSIVVKQLSSTELSGNALTLNFTDATSIEAGKPYLVKVSSSLNLATLPAMIDALSSPINPFKEVEVSKTAVPVETSVVDFIPTLGKTTITGDDAKTVLFLAEENKLKNPTTLPADMKGFRAYFQLKGDATSARSFSLNLGEETTGVEEFTNSRIEVLRPAGSPRQRSNQEGCVYHEW